jgi:RecB family exonuclease
VHRSLELLWQQVKSHEALTAMTEAELKSAIEPAVRRAVKEAAGKKPRTFTARFEAMESARLAGLLAEWLELEKKRAPFSVEDRERKCDIALAGFRVRTFADRIDRLADGRVVLLDYKTNRPGLRDWFTDRMAEPQLPLYATSLAEPVAAVIFGRVRKGEAGFVGLADEDGIAPEVPDLASENRLSGDLRAMVDLLDKWREKLDLLADEVSSGEAAVAPASIQESCRYCELHPLCRIRERALLEEPEHDRRA